MKRPIVFLISLYAASLIPIVSVPILMSLKSPATVSVIETFQFVAGYCHVGLTPFFYTESNLKDFFQKNATIYFWLPLAILAGTGLLFAFLPGSIVQNLLIPYFIWQTWHYQRQNFGVLSFVASLTKSGKVTSEERQLLNWGVIAGILGFFKLQFVGQQTLLQNQFDLLYQAGGLMMIGIVAFFIYTLFKHRNIIASPVRLSFLFITTFFYLPTFLFPDANSGVASYVFAHGMQYFVFMSFVAQGEVLIKPLIKLFSIAAIVTLLYLCAGTKVLFGLVPGAAMAHFVVDGHLWKMSQPFQRAYLKRSFDFIFQ
ncbi:hypothetical protein ACQ4M3_19645 [Leptolyngbya sp. AN03gr2]|uniref:hypothetical protein n=1 Tax=unclassified Leptolyngbya TaxID=2650499 RepID=UPI003D31F4B9